MVYFVSAGSSTVDLITIRGKNMLEQADVVIYAGSLVNPELLSYAGGHCQMYNSATMTLEEVLEVIKSAEASGLTTVRLHTGDPCLYGAIREQMDILKQLHIPYEVCPGVSSFYGATTALQMEYTLPEISQSVVITRMAGRTPVPERESIRSFTAHGTAMIIFLSTGVLEALSEELIADGYSPDTPAAIVYKATWPDGKTLICTVDTLTNRARKEHIKETALITVGNAVSQSGYERSKLYNPVFTTEFHQGTGDRGAER